MDSTQKKIMIALLVIVNLVIWSIFVIPKVGLFIGNFFSATHIQTEIAAPRPVTKKLDKIDFYTLRDPFQLPKGGGEKVTVVKPQVKKEVIKTVTTTKFITNFINRPETNVVVRTFTSRFKLKSIVILKDKYIAALEDSGRYNSEVQQEYSYRFGAQPEAQQGRSQVVIEGDSIQGEKVLKIRENYVIMEKSGLFYKLTFSGGFAVKDQE